MKKNILILIVSVGLISVSFTSCKKVLDLKPTNGVTVDVAYSTPEGYRQGFAKLYGAFALTGNGGPSGQPDIDPVIIDEGNSDFLRMFWNVQELSTDEAIPNASWNGNTDAGLHDFHNMNWAAGNPMLKGLYIRSAYQILLCNEFIRQCSDENLSRRGIPAKSIDTIKNYIPEARFLRAFQYWVLMDCFGNPAFATENDLIGSGLPRRITRAELFSYIESELKELATKLPAPRTAYGRADQAAANALLARIYLNAEVYTGTARYNDAVDYSKRVIDAGYSLETNYNWLFLNDNYQCTNEFIFTINYDGEKSQNFGGTNYIVWAGSNSDVGINTVGVNGWGGNRTTKNLPDLFPDFTGSIDKRASFFTTNRSKEIVDRVSDGYAVTKFKNINRDGSLGFQLKDLGVGIDMPLFRLAEQYLIYAEAVKRGGNGQEALALSYFNKIRERAYGNTDGNLTSSSSLTTDLILDERAREFYWECFRRTDLIRYKKFTEGTYLWPWKGNIPSGTGVASHYNLFPIPAPELSTNTNLVQNPGY